MMLTVIRWVLVAVLVWLVVEAALTVRAARIVIHHLPATVNTHLTAIIDKADARLASIDRRIADAVTRADARLVDVTERADAHAANTVAEVQAIRADLSATITDVRSAVADARAAAHRFDYWTNCEVNGLCWQGALTDTLMATRRAALTVDQSVPRMVAAAEASAAGVRATAEASAQTAQNLATLTKPAPKWVRWLGYGLGVAAPAAQVALPFALTKGSCQ